jgi:hypothetical protein
MKTLKGDNIYIRALEPNDLEVYLCNRKRPKHLGSKQYINPHSRFSETIFRNASGYL